jgi:hypothetical protein
MLRLVLRPDGVQVDHTGKLGGRGTYLHNQRSCWEKGLKGALAHSLKTNLSQENLASLRQYMLSLPEGEEDTAVGA